MTADLRPDDLLAFWFGGDAEERRRRHWGKDDAVDDAIRMRFGPSIERAAGGAFDAWIAEPRAALALVVLLDQLPRNAHRGTPRAFAFDAKAREVARDALDRGHDRALPADERTWLYLPFMHSEALPDQERCVALSAAHVLALQGPARKAAEGALGFARAHRDIVQRFGRFPHRNAILGRPSTPEEAEFLAQPGSSF